ncbi:MAG: polysaccharide deacetylase family protein [Candidatus Paceibacterota bacterium]
MSINTNVSEQYQGVIEIGGNPQNSGISTPITSVNSLSDIPANATGYYDVNGTLYSYVNGVGAGIGSRSISRTTPPDFVDTTDVIADYTVVVFSQGTATESTSFAKSSTKTIWLDAPPNNPTANAYIQADNKSVDFSDETTPILVAYYTPYIPAGSSLSLSFWASNHAALGNANRSSSTLTLSENIGWNIAPIDKLATGNAPYAVNLVQNGTAALNNANPIVSYRVQVSGGTTIHRQAYIDSITTGYRERPKIILTFDDNLKTGYNIGYVEARKRNIKTSFFLIYDAINSLYGMTTAQIKQIKDDPSVYCGLHGAKRFDGAGSGAGTTPLGEMTRNINGLKNLGLSDCRYMAWPEGETRSDDRSVCIDVAASLGIVGARTVQVGYNFTYNGCYEPLVMRAVGLSSFRTLAEVKSAIDTAILWGTSLVLFGHGFGAAADSVTWVTQDYIDLLDYIALKRSLGLIDDMCYDEWMDGLTMPVTTARF